MYGEAVCKDSLNVLMRYQKRAETMRTGKIPENVLKRSVFRQLHIKRSDVLLGAGVGEDCAALRLAADEIFVLSADPVIWTDDSDGRRAVHGTLNDLASSGAQPVGLMLTALLPTDIEEAQIRQMVKQIVEQCEPLGVQILGGHTEITDAVNRAVICVTGVGKVKEGGLVSTKGARPGDDIVITKWIGLEGTARIARAHTKELSARYPMHLIDEAKGFDRYLSIIPEAATAVKSGVRAMHDVTEGGIFGALWELAEASGVGLEIDLKKIPIRQETVEICEFFGLNPYQLVSGGSLLIASADGNALVMELNRAGIPAVVVGKAAAGNDRVLMNEEERRFLEPPKADEIHRIKTGE